MGGNSVSVNSNGIIQTINSLFSKDKNQDGMPRNIIARWLSESSSISKSFQEISNLKLASGYNYNIVSRSDGILNMETIASNQIITKIVPPFVHTNHYISELAVHDERSDNTFCRYQSAEKMCMINDNRANANAIKRNSNGKI